MEGILEVIGLVVVLIVLIVASMYVFLRKPWKKNEASKYVVYHFEKDNTSPKLTEMIEYHKRSSKKIKYRVERE